MSISASSSRSIDWRRAICASAPSSDSDSSPLNRTRSPSPPGSSRSRFDASSARSMSSRSSRSSASIIDSSSARCCGLSERMSECSAAIRSASWSMMSSKVRAPGKNRPCFARNSLASGSRPPIRWRMSSLRSRTISRLAARSSGVTDRMASLMPWTNWSSTWRPSRSTSSSKRWRASGSRKSYSRRSRIRSPTSDGSASSVSSRRAARSRAARPVSASGASAAARSSRRSTPARSWATISSSSRRMSPSTSPSSYRSRSSSRRRARRSMRSWRPGMSGRVGSPLRQPRSMSRRRASARSPSAMTSSDSAWRISSASRSGRRWVPSQRE